MRKRPTISVYLLGMNMVLLCVLFPAFSYFILRETVQLRDIQLDRNINMIRQGLVIRSASLVRNTAMSAREAVAGFDFTFLQNLVVEVVRDDPEILYCMIMDRSRTVVAHNDSNLVGSRLTGALDNRAGLLMEKTFPAKRPSGKIPVEYFWPEKGKDGGSRILEAVFPVYSGEALWGVIRCGYTLAPLEEEIVRAQGEWTAQMRQVTINFLYILLVFFLAGLAVVALLTRFFVRATRVLHAGVRQVAAGDLDREIALPDMACEEFVDLAASFNSMTEKLRLMRQQLDDYARSLERKVEERTQELEEAQDIMVRQAHEAGMAEMAVGVLHNTSAMPLLRLRWGPRPCATIWSRVPFVPSWRKPLSRCVIFLRGSDCSSRRKRSIASTSSGICPPRLPRSSITPSTNFVPLSGNTGT